MLAATGKGMSLSEVKDRGLESGRHPGPKGPAQVRPILTNL